MTDTDLTFVIPTYRLHEVSETVELYDDNFHRNGHPAPIIVFDDSSLANHAKYFAKLEQTRTENELYYVGRREKEESIRSISRRLRDKKLDLPVRNLFRPSYGGNRNFTLMYTLGQYMVSSDDDMRPYALIEDSPETLADGEISRGDAPGSRNAKRYQDVQDVLAAGIHVISAMNIQHLESLYNMVEHLVGVKVRERVPDAVLAEADQVVNIDLAAEDLQQRLRDGKVYPRDRVRSSLENFFTESNLEHLRGLTLRELAAQIDAKRRETTLDRAGHVPTAATAPDQIMVCLSSRGPNTARLLRFGSRLAGRLNRNWYAVYVQTPKEAPTLIDAAVQRLVADQLTLANQLGATVFTFKGQDVPDTILRFAAEYRVGQVVIRRPRPVPWYKRLAGEQSVAEELIHRARGVTVVVVDADADDDAPPGPTPPPVAAAAGRGDAGQGGGGQSGGGQGGALGRLLTADRIVIWGDAVTRDEVRRQLVAAIRRAVPSLPQDRVLQRLAERESQGSTYLNEGVALPHARLDELAAPQVAVGLTHAGVLDAGTDKPVEAVFLLLSPTAGANVHLQLLSRVGRALQDRGLRRALATARTPAEAVAVAAFGAFEAAGPRPAAGGA